MIYTALIAAAFAEHVHVSIDLEVAQIRLSLARGKSIFPL